LRAKDVKHKGVENLVGGSTPPTPVNLHPGYLQIGTTDLLQIKVVSGWTSDSWSKGRWFDSRPGRYHVNYVNSAFYSIPVPPGEVNHQPA